MRLHSYETVIYGTLKNCGIKEFILPEEAHVSVSDVYNKREYLVFLSCPNLEKIDVRAELSGDGEYMILDCPNLKTVYLSSPNDKTWLDVYYMEKHPVDITLKGICTDGNPKNILGRSTDDAKKYTKDFVLRVPENMVGYYQANLPNITVLPCD